MHGNDVIGVDRSVKPVRVLRANGELGLADTALLVGNRAIFDAAEPALEMRRTCGELAMFQLRRPATLTLHLLRDLWDQSTDRHRDLRER